MDTNDVGLYRPNSALLFESERRQFTEELAQLPGKERDSE